jgi:hypothetical protein
MRSSANSFCTLLMKMRKGFMPTRSSRQGEIPSCPPCGEVNSCRRWHHPDIAYHAGEMERDFWDSPVSRAFPPRGRPRQRGDRSPGLPRGPGPSGVRRVPPGRPAGPYGPQYRVDGRALEILRKRLTVGDKACLRQDLPLAPIWISEIMRNLSEDGICSPVS